MRSDTGRRPRHGLMILVAASLLAACGQASSSTTVVLTGPHDKVAALVAQRKALAPPVQAKVQVLDDGRERAEYHLPKGLPMGEVIDLGKQAAKAGISYEFSSGTNWGSGKAADAPGQDPPPARQGGKVV